MSQLDKTERLVEEYLESLESRTGGHMDHHIIQDSTRVMKEARQASRPPVRTRIRGAIRTHGTRRVAAVIALAIVLAGAVGLGGGSVAFSQVGHAVNSTLSRLKELITELRTGEFKDQTPLPTTSSGDADEQTPPAELRAVTCAARFFSISQREQSVWQSLREHGIELVQASSDPETYYATLTAEQAERFEEALPTKPITSPRVMVAEGEQAMIATDAFALAWLPTISSDGERIESTFSFHDGDNGFEIPNLSTEEGGIILVRVRGIAPTNEDVLILLKVSQMPRGR